MERNYSLRAFRLPPARSISIRTREGYRLNYWLGFITVRLALLIYSALPWLNGLQVQWLESTSVYQWEILFSINYLMLAISSTQLVLIDKRIISAMFQNRAIVVQRIYVNRKL